MTWLYLHFNQLQLNLAQQMQEQALPIIIVDAKHNVIKQCSIEAERLGIKIGMGLATALALADELTLLEYQADKEVQQLHLIASELYTASADIALQPPNSLCLRVDSMLKLYDSIETYWHTIKRHLHLFQLEYQYAFATTPLAAELLAKYSTQTQDSVITNNITQHKALEKLPIHTLGLTAKVTQSLTRVGIESIGQLRRLSLKDLAKRFEIDVVNTIGQLNGELKPKLTYFEPKTQFIQSLELLYEAKRTDGILPCLTLLLKQLERFLLQRNKVSSQLSIYLKQRDHDDLFVSVQSAKGIYKQQDWLKLLELKLERISLNSPVLAVELQCQNLRDITPRINDLFGQPQQGIDTDELISVLQAKLGEQAVHKLNYSNEYSNELASRIHPAQINEPPSDYQTSTDTQPIRPSCILHRPKKLTQAVQFKLGPERLNTAWWLPNNIQRDYFVARTQQGQLQWVFKTSTGEWYVQGLFS